MSEDNLPEPPESDEWLAARLLFHREHGFTSAKRLAAASELPLERVELLLCRGLSTLSARGWSAEELCETFTLTPEQFGRAVQAPTFGASFRPLCHWRPSVIAQPHA